MAQRPDQKHFMTVDVEDWFHILELDSGPGRDAWPSLESRVERNVDLLLHLFRAAKIQATFFIVGWVAERYPGLVRKVHGAGHEVASHSYWHEVVHRHNQESFRADVRASKSRLEDITGSPVRGFRAPGWSIGPKSSWALTLLAEEGFTYDSSLITGYASHGGFDTGFRGPHQIETPAGSIFEVPVASMGLGKARIPFSGGGYLRLLPYPVVRSAARRLERHGEPVCFYVHPREIDVEQPRMKLPLARRFKYYVGLKTTEGKLKKIGEDFALCTIGSWLDEHSAKVSARTYALDPAPCRPPQDASLIPPNPPAAQVTL